MDKEDATQIITDYREEFKEMYGSILNEAPFKENLIIKEGII